MRFKLCADESVSCNDDDNDCNCNDGDKDGDSACNGHARDNKHSCDAWVALAGDVPHDGGVTEDGAVD